MQNKSAASGPDSLSPDVSPDENKPIWMHAEEREEQSKVSVIWRLLELLVTV